MSVWNGSGTRTILEHTHLASFTLEMVCRCDEKKYLTLNQKKRPEQTSILRKKVSVCHALRLQMSFRSEGHTQKVSKISFIMHMTNYNL